MPKALLIGLFLVIAFSGCLETSNDNYANPRDENRAWRSNPTVQTVSGVNQVIDVSGDTIIISGLSNQIRVVNADVSKIVISGKDNLIYYPKDAHPEIINSGLGNIVKTY